MTVYAPTLTSLWRQLEDSGIEPEPLFQKHGVERSDLANPNARTSFQRIDGLLSEAAAASGDPWFCAREAEYIQPSQLGALGFAWLASVNLRRAITRLDRFFDIINPQVDIRLVEQDGSGVVAVEMELVADSVDPWVWDSGAPSALTRFCRFKCGDGWSPVRATLNHSAPDKASWLEDYLGCPVDYDAPVTSVHFDATTLDDTLPGTSAQLAELNDTVVVKYLAHLERGDIVNRVKAAILDHLPDGNASEAAIAEDLSMSTRNLHRRLSAEDTSFKGLLRETRQDLARQYINDPTLTLTEISFLLGFAEVSSFSRAYRKWHGESPSAARKALDVSG